MPETTSDVANPFSQTRPTKGKAAQSPDGDPFRGICCGILFIGGVIAATIGIAGALKFLSFSFPDAPSSKRPGRVKLQT